MILCQGKGTSSNKSKQFLQTTSTTAPHSRQHSYGRWFWEVSFFSTDLPFCQNGGETTPTVACDFGRRTSCSWETWWSKRCSPEILLTWVQPVQAGKTAVHCSPCDVFWVYVMFTVFIIFIIFICFSGFSLRCQEGNSLRWLEEALWSRSHLPWPDPPWWGLQAKWIRIEGQGVVRVGQGDHGANCSDLLPHEQCLFR